MKIALVTDTTAYIPDELLLKYDIHTIPLSVVFGDDSFREGIDITTEDFYDRVRTEKTLPTTSQPPIGMFMELYEGLSESYDAIISVHLSKKISGTYDAAIAAGNMVEGVEVYPFDSGLSAMPQGMFVLKAAEMIQEGIEIQTILETLEDMKQRTYAYFMVDDLSHLQRGGRLSSAQALVGSLLHIKPVLHMPEGKIIPFEKIRTRKKALKRIMGMLEKDAQANKIVRVVFIHANDEASALELQQEFQTKYPQIETIISGFGPVIGTHLGEGSLGVSWYKE